MSDRPSVCRVGVDVGGTFTDVVLNDGGVVRTAKVSSVPEDPARGFFAGVERVIGEADAGHEAIELLFHGSTVATNAILEGRGARTGMLVTDGFKYVLEIGRAEIPRRENLFAWVKPKRPVPPRLILEVPERVRLDGTVDRALDEDGCRAAARALGAAGVEAVAIVFLHAWANPAHERRARDLVHEELPGAAVSLSSDVLPVFREYERSMATVLNARVQPLVGRYVGRIESGLAERGVEAPFFVMKSNGGMFSPREAIREPVHMALSGPAAGVRGAAFIGAAAGCRDLIAIDMGGTSADVSLVRDAAPSVTKDGEIGPFPLPIPMVDIHTIGAGGGSIASVTADGSLVVGPRSAGADPGPACYGRGGEEPTVTDANLVLGRIPPHLLDGEIPLDPARAEAALRERVAKPLGLGLEEAARGILAIVNNNMAGALRVVSVERGLDPRAFTLCAFGGAGPVHGGDLARELGAPRLLVPRHPGILCALGLLATDLRYDFARTRVQRPPTTTSTTWPARCKHSKRKRRPGSPPNRWRNPAGSFAGAPTFATRSRGWRSPWSSRTARWTARVSRSSWSASTRSTSASTPSPTARRRWRWSISGSPPPDAWSASSCPGSRASSRGPRRRPRAGAPPISTAGGSRRSPPTGATTSSPDTSSPAPRSSISSTRRPSSGRGESPRWTRTATSS